MQQAINRSFDILEYIASSPETPRSFSEIATNVGLNTGTCANIIKAMVKRGYLEKLDDKKGYLLGKKLYQLTNFDGYRKDLIKIAQPVLEKLTSKLNENFLLAVLKGSSRIVLFQTQSNQEVQATSAIDKHAYDSSTGRLLIAMLPDDEIEHFISSYGLPPTTVWKGASTKKSFYKEIEKIRQDGYAVQESERSIAGIAVGVSQGNKVVAAICMFLPAFRMAHLEKLQLIKDLKTAADQISSALSQ